MGIEIERKFLVKVGSDGWRQGRAFQMTQGYISETGTSVVRVRVSRGDHDKDAEHDEGADRPEQAWLTVKGATLGATRAEFEYQIPVAEAREMLDSLCDKVIDKTRFVNEIAGHTWEVDEFYGLNQGLIVAEIELGSEDESFVLPDWVGDEVTADSRYYNSSLSNTPFTSWNDQ